MSKWSRRVTRGRGRRRKYRTRTETRVAALSLAGAALAVTAVVVTVLVYALTRPPKLPRIRWPAFRGTIARLEGGRRPAQQVWWRKESWCSRVVYTDGSPDAWKVSLLGRTVALGILDEAKSALEVTGGPDAGPTTGFGPQKADEVRAMWRSKEARIVGAEDVAGRGAQKVRVPRGKEPAATEKTWWLDDRYGITMRYLERDAKQTFAHWQLRNLREGSGPPPWKTNDLRGLDELLARPLGIVTVDSGEGRPGSQQVVDSSQYPAYAEQVRLAFSVCRPGSPATISPPTPAPSPGTPPGPG